MPPRWVRRLGFHAVLLFGALVVQTVGTPEACADVWTWEHHERRCCQLASQTRWTGPNGDCCDAGRVEDRDPGASSASIDVPPAAWVRVAPGEVVVAPAAARWLQGDQSIPERPPDRAIRTTVLLI